MKHNVKAPIYTRLKLKCDSSLPRFAFKFSLRRYIEVFDELLLSLFGLFHSLAGRCRLTLNKPR